MAQFKQLHIHFKIVKSSVHPWKTMTYAHHSWKGNEPILVFRHQSMTVGQFTTYNLQGTRHKCCVTSKSQISCAPLGAVTCAHHKEGAGVVSLLFMLQQLTEVSATCWWLVVSPWSTTQMFKRATSSASAESLWHNDLRPTQWFHYRPLQSRRWTERDLLLASFEPLFPCLLSAVAFARLV